MGSCPPVENSHRCTGVIAIDYLGECAVKHEVWIDGNHGLGIDPSDPGNIDPSAPRDDFPGI